MQALALVSSVESSDVASSGLPSDLSGLITAFASLDSETFDSFVKTVKEARKASGSDLSPNAKKLLSLQPNGVDTATVMLNSGTFMVLECTERKSSKGRSGGTSVVLRNKANGESFTLSSQGDSPEWVAGIVDMKLRKVVGK